MKLGGTYGKSMFHTDAAGNTIFYPWSFLGKGYVVPGNEKKEQLLRFLRQTNILGAIFIVVFIISSSRLSDSTTFVVGILAGYAAWYYWNIKDMIKDMVVASERLPFVVACKNAAPDFHILFLVIAEACMVLLLLLTGRLFTSSDGALLTLIGFVVFGFTAVIIGCMIYFKLKKPE